MSMSSDPSEVLCRITDSFSGRDVKVTSKDLPTPFELKIPSSITTFITRYSLSKVSNLEPKYSGDANVYSILQKVKNTFSNPNFISARNAANPFEELSRSIFMNRAAIKIANLDALYNFTNHNSGLISYTDESDDLFTFCDVASGPGGFTEYIQFRRRKARGYGMSLRDTSKSLQWNTDKLDMSRFIVTYGDDNTGNLYTQWEWFTKFISDKEPTGVDLVMADGGFEVEDIKEGFERQEYLTSHLLMAECAVGIKCCKEGGTFVVKCFNTVTQISAEIVFILAQCFEKISIIKPVSSRPANEEQYIICTNKKPISVTEYYFSMLKQALDSYEDKDSTGESIFVTSFIKEPLPEDFTKWLEESNKQSIRRQVANAKQITTLMSKKDLSLPNQVEYNLRKCLNIWNLPDSRYIS